MGNLNETEKWEENIYQLETSDPVLGGADGISNRAPRQLANRTKWLKKKTEEAAQSLAEHVRSRNHPDATLTAKGFTQLSSATNSTSETLAATPKAVKAAYDLAAGKAPVSHTHLWSQITGVPAASLTAKGTVQLSSDINSTSEILAATPKAVKAAYDLAAGKAPVSHTHPWSQITGVPAASLTAKGTVQLSSDINSTSEILAATPKAVKAAYDLAAGKAPASHTHPWSQITGVPAASLTAKGTVQLSSATDSQSETEAATPKAVKAAYDLAAGKAPVSHTHPWSQITGVPAASLTAKGTVQLSSDINSTSEILAATPKAVKAAYDLANGKQPADATLTALAGLATAADRLPYFTGADRAALTTLTAIGRAIIAMGSIKEVLNYLQLGEAAKRDVGTGNNQLPDMSAFGMSRNGQTAWDILPNGMIRQAGTVTLTPVGNFNAQVLGGVTYYTHYYRVNFPRQFPNAQIATLATLASYSYPTQSTMAGKSLATHRDTDSGTDVSRTRFTVAYTTPNLGETPTLHFEAIGY